jgi:hypothetical protein
VLEIFPPPPGLPETKISKIKMQNVKFKEVIPHLNVLSAGFHNFVFHAALTAQVVGWALVHHSHLLKNLCLSAAVYQPSVWRVWRVNPYNLGCFSQANDAIAAAISSRETLHPMK